MDPQKMKFFIGKHRHFTDSAAAVERLNAIVDRGQAEISFYLSNEEPTKAEGVRRRFWRPEELPEGSASD